MVKYMVIRNGIPSEALIFETIIVVLMSTLAMLTLIKFFQRRRVSTFHLFLTNTAFALAVLSSAIGKYVNFFDDAYDYSGFAINIAYCFVALGNTFLYAFLETVYLADLTWRKYLVGFFNGILIGIFLNLNSLEQGAYDRIFNFVLVLIIFSFTVYLTLIRYSFKEWSRAQSGVPKIGFFFIGLFGVFLMCIFIFFAVDIVLIILNDQAYSFGYYLAWSSGAIAVTFGYLGYIMPLWLQNLISRGSDLS